MRRYLILLLLLTIPLVCRGDGWFYGSAAPAEECTTDAVDSAPGLYETYDANMAIFANARGQGFRVSAAGKISAIEIYVGLYVAGPEGLTIRWGTGTDLTTYVAEATGSPSATGWYKFTFETKGDVVAETTYYFGLVGDGASAGDTRMGYDDVDGAYSSATYFSATSSGWNMTSSDPTHDLAFRVYLCAD